MFRGTLEQRDFNHTSQKVPTLSDYVPLREGTPPSREGSGKEKKGRPITDEK